MADAIVFNAVPVIAAQRIGGGDRMFGVIAGDGSGGNGVVGLSHNGGAGDGMISKGRKRDGSEGQGQNDFFHRIISIKLA